MSSFDDDNCMQSPPPGFPRPGLARAPQPACSIVAPAGRATQHVSRSTAVVCLIL